MKQHKKSWIIADTHRLLFFIVVTFMAGIGVYALHASHAATGSTAFEAESARLNNNSGTYGDTAASGGTYIQFGGTNYNSLAPAVDSPDWNSIFARAQQPRGWIGGDGGYSLKLPDGRVLFMYADSIIGTVNATKSIDPYWRLIHNSLVTINPDGTHFVTYNGGALGQETAYIANPTVRPDDQLWPYAGVVDGSKVYVYLNEWQPDPKGAFGLTYTGNLWVAQLDAATLAVEKTTQIVTADNVQWGSTAYQDSTYNYIFGHLDTSAPDITTYMFRTARGQANGKIEYRTATGWSAARSDAKPISTVDIEAVTQLKNGQYQALFMANVYPHFVQLATAPAPYGPWTITKTNVAPVPETDINGLLAYMPRIHPALSGSNGYVMSYSVNAYNINDVIAHASNYQPHFYIGPSAQ